MSFELLLTLGAVFTAVAIASGSIASLALARQTPERKRLRELARPKSPQLIVDTGRLTETPDPTAQKIASFIPKSPKEMTKLRRKLAKAGYHGPWPAITYSVLEFTAPIAFAGIPLFFLPLRTGWILSIIAAVIGFLLPGLFLGRQITARQKVIENGLPDALDLFIVCLEAGSSLDQAIVKASEELDIAYPALAEELRMLTLETRAGKPRLEAFKNFAQRTGVDDVRALVSMLVQTDKFGTSVAQALRTHAETARTKRRQRAEERAAKIGVKLVFPLVFCLFPAFYVVTLGPAVVQFVRVFFGQMVPGAR
jgi:tight adherence protein C